MEFTIVINQWKAKATGELKTGGRSWRDFPIFTCANHFETICKTWKDLKRLEKTWKDLKRLEKTWKNLKRLEKTWDDCYQMLLQSYSLLTKNLDGAWTQRWMQTSIQTDLRSNVSGQARARNSSSRCLWINRQIWSALKPLCLFLTEESDWKYFLTIVLNYNEMFIIDCTATCKWFLERNLASKSRLPVLWFVARSSSQRKTQLQWSWLDWEQVL